MHREGKFVSLDSRSVCSLVRLYSWPHAQNFSHSCCCSVKNCTQIYIFPPAALHLHNNNSEWEMFRIAEHMSCRNNKYEPLATGETIRIFANAAPCPCPIKVTMLGLPLNAGRFSRSQCRPATRSIKPKFPWALPFVPVFKNPLTSNCRKRGKRVEMLCFHSWDEHKASVWIWNLIYAHICFSDDPDPFVLASSSFSPSHSRTNKSVH